VSNGVDELTALLLQEKRSHQAVVEDRRAVELGQGGEVGVQVRVLRGRDPRGGPAGVHVGGAVVHDPSNVIDGRQHSGDVSRCRLRQQPLCWGLYRAAVKVHDR